MTKPMKMNYVKSRTIAEIKKYAGKMKPEDIAKKIGIRLSQLTNLAWRNKIPLRCDNLLRNPIHPGSKFTKLTVIQWHDYAKRPTGKGKRMSRYLCECACTPGSRIIVFGCQLKNGFTKSCGCYQDELNTKMFTGQIPKNKLDKGKSAFNNLYKSYIRRAKNTIFVNFSLTENEFEQLIYQNCYYCGVAPNRLHPKKLKGVNGQIIVNGIDRLDSNRGYTKENCVTCCQICNRAKNNMNYLDFQEWIKKVTDYQIRRYNG